MSESLNGYSNTTPTVDERILALEANGDYSEAMPLYQQASENKNVRFFSGSGIRSGRSFCPCVSEK